MLQNQTEIYVEGFKSGLDMPGRSRIKPEVGNPHKTGTKNYTIWQRGFSCGQTAVNNFRALSMGNFDFFMETRN